MRCPDVVAVLFGDVRVHDARLVLKAKEGSEKVVECAQAKVTIVSYRIISHKTHTPFCGTPFAAFPLPGSVLLSDEALKGSQLPGFAFLLLILYLLARRRRQLV